MDRLLSYITDRTAPADWRHAHQLAAAARALAYTTRQRPAADDDGVPGYLATAARTIVRRHATRYLDALTGPDREVPTLPTITTLPPATPAGETAFLRAA